MTSSRVAGYLCKDALFLSSRDVTSDVDQPETRTVWHILADAWGGDDTAEARFREYAAVIMRSMLDRLKIHPKAPRPQAATADPARQEAWKKGA